VARDNPPSAMVVVAGSDVHHDLLNAALVLQNVLTEAGLRARRAVGLERFVSPLPATADSDVFVFYTAGGQLSQAEQDALAASVAAGKGLVALHASAVYGSDGTVGSPDRTRAELLGCRYLSHGLDGVFGHYKVEMVTDHAITVGLDDFEIDDEYYNVELIKEANPDVLVERSSVIGREPILLARTHGAGRVCYLSLGHDMRAWGNPGFKDLVSRAALWVAGNL
jgi:uncharacterized protein